MFVADALTILSPSSPHPTKMSETASIATIAAVSTSANISRSGHLSFIDTDESTRELSDSQRKTLKRVEWLYFAVVTYSMFLNGWNDGTIGPLMPVIQRDYHVAFEIAALLFVSNCVVSLSLSLPLHSLVRNDD